MFKMTPAIAWLERDYDSAMALECQDYPETSEYGGLRHFQARGRYDSTANDCIGLMFSLKIDHARKPWRWSPVRPSWQDAAWEGLPLDDEVRWL